MKKHIVRLIALLIFASVAMSSCEIEYREHNRHWDHDHDRGDRGHDHDDHDHDYRNYNH